MSIFAIADLHLSFQTNKPMNIFGWEGYEKKIQENWVSKVKNEDLVLLPGDFSWGLYLNETVKDFEFINNLPGKKILLKGNHDYWWTTLTSMRKFLNERNFQNIDFLYNNSYLYEDKIIAGTRGWNIQDEKEDKKIQKREEIRLKISLDDGIKKYGTNKGIIVCMHYPPFESNLIEIMKQYNVKTCIYGHLHGESHKKAICGKIDNIDFKLVSADYTEFDLIKIF